MANDDWLLGRIGRVLLSRIKEERALALGVCTQAVVLLLRPAVSFVVRWTCRLRLVKQSAVSTTV